MEGVYAEGGEMPMWEWEMRSDGEMQQRKITTLQKVSCEIAENAFELWRTCLQGTKRGENKGNAGFVKYNVCPSVNIGDL